MRTRVPPSTYTAQNDYYYQSDYKGNYPDYPPGGFDAYNYNAQRGYNDTDSVTRLAAAAAPIAGQNDQNAAYGNYVVDPNDAYYANGGSGYAQTQYTQGQYGQAQYSQGQYGHDQYSQQQQYYQQDQYAQHGQGQNAYSQSQGQHQQHGQYTNTQHEGLHAYDSDLGTPTSGLPYDSSVRGSGLKRDPSAQAGNPGAGRAR
jgi:hypothetical protein